ncbi:MAG: ParB/RepB/Spo0J family partition protein [Acidobacteria bacterium]|nr:ParB/RepB/Spo0J family partition protein [Acidobacteriota bacterium]
MSDDTAQILKVPVADICVLNPRSRNRRIFNELVASIAHLGLKKPITVSRRIEDGRFNLVCGQGRLEAFIALGQTEIPAIVIEAPPEDCYVMSLVENMARRHHSSLELVAEVGSLRQRGYSTSQIAEKIDLSPDYVTAISFLLEQGEERLLKAVEHGDIPHSIAIEIARAKDGEVQAALLEAYEANTLPGNQVLTIRKIIEQRTTLGKSVLGSGKPNQKRIVSATSLVSAYRKETDRKRLLIKKAELSQSRLLFIVNALRKLIADPAFVRLLREERLASLPKPIASRVEG